VSQNTCDCCGGSNGTHRDQSAFQDGKIVYIKCPRA
jgi:hypothetical protein